MKFRISFIFIWSGIGLFAQDYLSPLEIQPLLNPYSKPKLTPRADDSTNYKIDWEVQTLPFVDEFSTNRQRPLDLSQFNAAAEYYVIGKCVDILQYNQGWYRFMKTQSTDDIYDPTNPPLYNRQTNNPIILFSLNDSPDCNTLISENIYPPTRIRHFSSSGTLIFDSIIYDTVIYAAHIKELTLKGYLWLDRYAYINTHIPYMPPSKGVATLDGLNEYGKPYNKSVTNAYGLADYLTSAPIDLTGLDGGDSVYLSFMYQPQGLGDWPDYQDSLMVEFLDNRGRWQPVWIKHGLTRAQGTDTMTFYHTLIYIPDPIVPSDPIYFYDKFQFRFKNYATISGNNDHWHIDFVKLDANRNYQDTTIRDFNFVYNLPTLLKNYTLLPTQQYRGSIDLKDTVEAINRNISSPIFSAFKYICYNENTGTTYGSNSAGITYSADPLVYHKLAVSGMLMFPNTIEDSTYIQAKVYLDPSDDYVTNDTASHRQFFFNEMAYDDGSAEMAYGIQGLGTKKVAYRFVIPNKDTLAAIKILFSNIDVDVENLVFNINIWKQIGMNGAGEKTLKTLTNIKPIYFDTLNGYATFGLDEPLEVQDTIYVGWVQTDERNLQIGYDRNSELGHNHIFIFTNNIWSKTNIVSKGSPMMRLILDGVRKYGTNKLSETPRLLPHISAYPNPASHFVTIETDDYKKKELIIYNLLGKNVLQTSFTKDIQTDISELDEGIYLVNILVEGKSMYQNKLQILR